MKNRLVVIIFSFFLLGNNLISNAQITIENPHITPMTPESASLGRYGNIALAGATGQMNYSVPIYNIEVDGNSWPISLNYNYSGLILEGKPSLSGLGWQLMAYGNITKETRGLPDGHPEGYYGSAGVNLKIDDVVSDYFDQGSLYYPNTAYGSNPFDKVLFSDLEKFQNGTWDSEVDKYTVNVGNINFSFKVYPDSNNNGAPTAYYLSKHNYKVNNIVKDPQKTFTMLSFEVIDDRGTTYYFDSDDREVITQDPYTEYAEDPTTSWMLSEIRYTNGQSIQFEYDLDQYFSYDFYAFGYENDLDASTPGQDPTDVPVQNWSMGYGDGVRKSFLNRQILRSIAFPKGSIDLTTVTNTDQRKLYTELTLKDKSHTIVDTYTFSYVEKRDALRSIKKNGENYFDFEYYGIDTGAGYIPGFIDHEDKRARSQDYWRYYNNANNARAIHLPYSSQTANKLPNFSATRTGALKRIIYPTKGYTEINYEQNQVKVPYEDNPGGNGNYPGFNDELILRVNAKTSNNERKVTVRHTFTYPVRASLYHKIKGNVIHGNSIYLKIQKVNGPNSLYANEVAFCGSCFEGTYQQQSQPYYPFELDNARSHINTDPTENPYYPLPVMMPRLVIDHDPDNNCAWFPGSGDAYSQAMGCVSQTEIDALDDSGGAFWIVPGEYEFEIDVRNLAYDDLFAEIGLKWYDPALENGGTLPDFMNANVGGIRVNKIADYTDDGEFTSVKHYDYNDDEGFSTARLNLRPHIKDEHIWHHEEDIHTPSVWTQTFDAYLLNSYIALNNSYGTPVYYNQIKSFNSNSLHNTSIYPNGYTLQKFSLPEEDLNDTYPRVPLLEDKTKAVPTENYVKSSDNIDVSSKVQNYTPVRWGHMFGTVIDENLLHPWSFKYYKNLENIVDWNHADFNNPIPALGTLQDYSLKSLHDIKFYKEVNSKRILKDETSTIQGITNVQTLTYDSDLLLQSSVTHDSEGNETKIEYDYPSELSESQYIGMYNVNQVSTPVIQRTYKNNDLLSQQKTNFEPINQSGLVIGYRPKEILTAKSTDPLKKEIEFQYNTNNSLVEYLRNEGHSPPTSFIWGYSGTVPVAKVENATYNEALGALSTPYSTMQTQTGTTLRNTLNSIRQGLPNALVTTYTYNPLIGVSSITNPKGETLYYDYDNLNRLQYIKDKDENVLEEYNYHIKLEELSGILTSSSSEVYQGQPIDFYIFPSGGSGNYKYSWIASNSNGIIHQILNTNSNVFNIASISANYTPDFTVSCEITDITTNHSVTKTKNIIAHNSTPPLTINNILASGTNTVGQDMTYTITVNGGSGNFEYHWWKQNGLGYVDIETSSNNSIADGITSNDCQSFTIFCSVTDLSVNQMIATKWLVVSVANGCSGGNN